MSSKYRRLYALLGLVVLWGVYRGLQHFGMTHPNREHAMIEPLRDMQTFCIGRFLIDLPKGTTIVAAEGSGLGERFSAEYPVSRTEFTRRVAERWSDLEKKTADAYGKPYAQPTKRLEPFSDAVLFMYEHMPLSVQDSNGVSREIIRHESVGYLWRDNVLYTFDDHPIDNRIIETMRTLKVWQHNSIPNESGFCGARSFFAGGAKPESISMAFRLPAKPDIEFRLDTTTWSNSNDGISGAALVTPPRPNIAAYETEDFKGTVHRDARRSQASLPGTELIEGVTQRKSNYNESTITADWFGVGEPSSSGKPAIHAKMEITYRTAEPPSPWGGFPPKKTPEEIGEEEFMAYWDTILNTLRLRPGALQPGENSIAPAMIFNRNKAPPSPVEGLPVLTR